MGHGEDNLWSLFKDMMPLWIIFAFFAIFVFVYSKTPATEPPHWMQNRYVRCLGAVVLVVSIVRGVFQAIHNWRLFYGLH